MSHTFYFNYSKFLIVCTYKSLLHNTFFDTFHKSLSSIQKHVCILGLPLHLSLRHLIVVGIIVHHPAVCFVKAAWSVVARADVVARMVYHAVKLVFTSVSGLWLRNRIGGQFKWDLHLPFVLFPASFKESFEDHDQDLIEFIGHHGLEGRLILLASCTGHGTISLHQLRFQKLFKTILKSPIVFLRDIQVDSMIFLKKNKKLFTLQALVNCLVPSIDNFINNWLLSSLVPLFCYFP